MQKVVTNINLESKTEEVVLFDGGDIHLGAKNSAELEFADTLNKIANCRKTHQVLSRWTGDLTENIPPNDKRFSLRNVQIDPDTLEIFDCSLQKQEMIRYLGNLANTIGGKNIFAVAGNHEGANRNTNSYTTWEICQAIGATYGENVMIHIINLLYKGKILRTVRCRIQHGWGGGRTWGRANKLDMLFQGFPNLDMVVIGHLHLLFEHSDVALEYTSSGKCIRKELLKIISGSYYRTYLEGTSSYAESSGYSPLMLGCIKTTFGVEGFYKVEKIKYV